MKKFLKRLFNKIKNKPSGIIIYDKSGLKKTIIKGREIRQYIKII